VCSTEHCDNLMRIMYIYVRITRITQKHLMTNSASVFRIENQQEWGLYMDHSAELVQNQSWKRLEKNVFFHKFCMYANYIISKVQISSNYTVNSHIVFSESFGIFFLSPNLSLPKHNNKSFNKKGHIDLLRFCLHLPCKYIFLLFFKNVFTGKSIAITILTIFQV